MHTYLRHPSPAAATFFSAANRRQFLHSLTAVGVASLVGNLPLAAYAAPTMKIMIPANPGGGWDSTGRAFGKAMTDAKLAEAVQYENKGGASGALGLAQFFNARKGDPHALIVMGAVMLGGQIQNKPAVGLEKLTAIARLTTEYGVFVLPTNSRFKTMKEVVEALQKDPASVRWGGGSKGSTEHVAAAMIARHAGVPASGLNYLAFAGGGEATAAILGGNVDVGGSGYSEFRQYIETGKMRAIAITAPSRMVGINIPTLIEQGIPVELGNWRGLYGAADITPAQRDALTQLVLLTTKTPTWQAALKTNSWTPAVLTGLAFDKFVEESFAALRAVMVQAGMV